jgi:hypothetical protein
MNKNKLFYFILGFIIIIFIIYMMNYTSIIEGATNNNTTLPSKFKLSTTINNIKKYLAINMNNNCMQFKLTDDINLADVFTYNDSTGLMVDGKNAVYCNDIKQLKYGNGKIYYLETITGAGQTGPRTYTYTLKYINDNLSFGFSSGGGAATANIIKFDNIKV